MRTDKGDYPMHESTYVYQFDHEHLDVLVQDLHLAEDQSARNIHRPHLIIYYEPESRRVVGTVIGRFPVKRRVTKRGIRYDGLTYWHAHLVAYLGQEVCVRAESQQTPPASVEIFVSCPLVCTSALRS